MTEWNPTLLSFYKHLGLRDPRKLPHSPHHPRGTGRTTNEIVRFLFQWIQHPERHNKPIVILSLSHYHSKWIRDHTYLLMERGRMKLPLRKQFVVQPTPEWFAFRFGSSFWTIMDHTFRPYIGGNAGISINQFDEYAYWFGTMRGE